MPRVRKTGTAGFTIIELMMVMAIIGMIMLFVLRAIPALQRNSHNTQRKQNVASILGAISRYQLNNGGNFPPTPTPADDYLKYAKLTQYDPVDITLHPGVTTDVSPMSNINKVEIYNYHRCDKTNNGASTQGADYRDVVALFGVEKGSGTSSAQCQQL